MAMFNYQRVANKKLEWMDQNYASMHVFFFSAHLWIIYIYIYIYIYGKCLGFARTRNDDGRRIIIIIIITGVGV